MYLSHWQLVERPFQNTQDTRFTFLADQHREGLARMLYIVEGEHLGAVLAGPYGVGKSLILEMLGQKLAKREGLRYLKLDVPPNGAYALARQIARKIGHKGTVMEIADALNALEDFCSADGGRTRVVLGLDEAHLLSDEQGLQFLRLITNLRLGGEGDGAPASAVTLILAGHDELVSYIAGDPALHQRLHVNWRLEPLAEDQVIEYVQFRVRTAGGDPWMFEEDGLRELHRASGGIPRVVNNICDMALLLGQAAGSPRVTRDIMQQAIQELQVAAGRAEPLQEVPS